MAVDKPKIDFVLADLKKEVEAGRPEDYVVVLSGSKRVTFKYPLSFKRSEREQFVELFDKAKKDGDDTSLLQRMLSDADLKRYESEDLDNDVHTALMERLMAHFQGTLGDAGNDSASES